MDSCDPLVDAVAGEGRISEPGADGTPPAPPQRPSRPMPAAVRLRFDRKAGWPPVLEGDTKKCCLPHAATGIGFDPAAQRRSRDAALCDPEVRSLLNGRWETLGVYLVWNRDPQCEAGLRVQVCFFNYTCNQLIEVAVDDGAVSGIRVGESFQHPEAPVEMAQAIGLARAHPAIRNCVANLDAHAILSVPMDASAPNYRHRCLLVIFTEPYDPHREAPVKFSALVDLCDQTVAAFGECACADEQYDPHRAPRQT
jgi:hypothetical protein